MNWKAWVYGTIPLEESNGPEEEKVTSQTFLLEGKETVKKSGQENFKINLKKKRVMIFEVKIRIHSCIDVV